MTRRSFAVASCLNALSALLLAGQAGKVLVGYCVGLKGPDSAKAAGFDYVELGVTEIAALSDADFDAAVERVKQAGIPTLNANLFLSDPATPTNLPYDASGNLVAARSRPKNAGFGVANAYQTPRQVQLQIRFRF